ncbi:MAG: TIGR04372 family glycosyltransferase [Candidatus Omnitrophica bacterium]|nr:TIGR04372 family glycosyltransferase [Candidatus Omnitrophota bacterium]
MKALFFLPAFLFVIVMRVLRPFVLIRLNCLHSYRIGHFCGNTEVYLCERDAGMHGNRVFDIFFYDYKVCNHQVLKMWKRIIPVVGPLFAYGIMWVNRKFPGWEAHEYISKPSQYCDTNGLLDKSKAHLYFTQQEERKGQKALRDLGIPEGSPFVCFIARDGAYLDKDFSGEDWSYHNYRNSDIKNFDPAMKWLIDRGYYGVRMGSVVKNKLPFSYPGIIDYAANGMRSDFMDVYLTMKCSFFLFSESGISMLAMILRKPVVGANLIPIGFFPAWGKDYVCLPKKLWLTGEKRFLTFREIVKSEIAFYFEAQQYQKRGLEVVENTSEEIRDAVEEMTARLENRWETNEEYEDLQRRFWSLYEPNEILRVFRARIGAKFLMQNQDLLK